MNLNNYSLSLLLMSSTVIGSSLLLTSCGGNKQTHLQTVAEELAAESAAQSADDLSSEPQTAALTTVDKPTFSFTIPDGWLPMPGDNEAQESAMVFKGKDVTDLMDAAYMMVTLGDDEGKTLEESMVDFLIATQAKQIDDVTIQGKTLKAFTVDEDGMHSTILVAHEGHKFVTFTITKTTAQDPGVQTIIGSFKLK